MNTESTPAQGLRHRNSLKRELGFISVIAVIVGEMIGSGIYMLPQQLAQAANPVSSVIALLVTGAGTIFLAISFSRLGSGDAQDSAVVCTQRAFGDLSAFWVGWAYWCGCWISNGAIILAGLNYMGYFFPVLAQNGIERFLICIAVLWLYTLVDVFGIKKAGILNLVLTVLKLLPLLIFAVVAAMHFDIANFSSVSSPELSGLSAVPSAMVWTLWCFLGFEGANVNADAVSDRKRIGKATIGGTVAVVVIYLAIIVLSSGCMNQESLASSESPLADCIASVTGGGFAGALIAIGGAVSALGCVGPWVLSGGTVAYSLGKLNLLPSVFAKVDEKHGTPKAALLINGVLMTLVMTLGYLTQEGGLYNFLVLLATIVYLVFYAFGAASEIVLSAKKIKPFNLFNFIKCSFISLIGLAYSIYTIYGAGSDGVCYGFLLLMIGLPVFVYIKLSAEAKAK